MPTTARLKKELKRTGDAPGQSKLIFTKAKKTRADNGKDEVCIIYVIFFLFEVSVWLTLFLFKLLANL